MQDPTSLAAAHAQALAKPTPTPSRPAEEQAPSEPEQTNSKQTKVWTFAFNYKSPEDGVVYKGLFTNRVPSIREKIQIASYESTLNSGVPYDSIDPTMGQLSRAVATMQYTLIQKLQMEPEGWANDLLALHSPLPIFRLAEEVYAHEATFRGLADDPESGEGESS